MKDYNFFDELIEYLKLNDLIKCVFTDDNYHNNINLIDNLFVYIDKKNYNIVYEYIHNYLFNESNLLADYHYNFLSRYYFENNCNINIIYTFDFDLNICSEIINLYDPYNLFLNFKTLNLPFKNIEFINNLNDLLVILFDFCNYQKNKDNIFAYKKSLEIEELFVYIYRGFYDSLNAKKGFSDINKTMNNNYYIKLIEIIRYFDYDNYIVAVKLVINEIQKMIDKLSITMLSSFKLDFYNYIKKIIDKF